MPVPTLSSGSFEAADVYRNLLHKKVSIRLKGKVVAHAEAVIVSAPEFRVQLGKLAHLRRVGQKEVCAYVRGDVEILAQLPASALPEGAQRVCFDPYRHDTFVLADGTPVVAADLFIMTAPCGSWVVNPR